MDFHLSCDEPGNVSDAGFSHPSSALKKESFQGDLFSNICLGFCCFSWWSVKNPEKHHITGYFESSNKNKNKKRGKPPWNLNLSLQLGPFLPPLKVGPVARCPVGGGLSEDKCVSTLAPRSWLRTGWLLTVSFYSTWKPTGIPESPEKSMVELGIRNPLKISNGWKMMKCNFLLKMVPPFWGGYQLDIDTYIYLGIPTSAKAKTKLCPALATCQFAIDRGLDHSGDSNLSVCHEWCPISQCTWSDYLWLSTILYVI